MAVKKAPEPDTSVLIFEQVGVGIHGYVRSVHAYDEEIDAWQVLMSVNEGEVKMWVRAQASQVSRPGLSWRALTTEQVQVRAAKVTA